MSSVGLVPQAPNTLGYALTTPLFERLPASLAGWRVACWRDIRPQAEIHPAFQPIRVKIYLQRAAMLAEPA